eukprot:6459265-Amphidinium_carterae.1
MGQRGLEVLARLTAAEHLQHEWGLASGAVKGSEPCPDEGLASLVSDTSCRHELRAISSTNNGTIHKH